jgi:chromosomal replication initiator protein
MNAWLQVLNYLKTKVNTQSYQTWLRPTRFSRVENEAIVVCVPNREFQEWILENYAGLITEA